MDTRDRHERVRSQTRARDGGGPIRAVLASLLSFLLLVAVAPQGGAQQGETPVDLTIAFLGDQGLGGDAEAVLRLIRDEGADAVIHMGDFDYAEDPAAWDGQIDAVLGADFPYFASAGNHDEAMFYEPGGYQDLLEARMNRVGISWQGDLGVQSAFHYAGIFVVFTAPGSFGDGDDEHAPYIRDQLAGDDSVWSISAWHKNMQLLQVGGKSDETGWGVYEESRRGGAIMATAHEHSYSRTHLLADVEHQEVASTSEPLVLAADDPATPEDGGRSFAFVSGLGGRSIRDRELDGPWWASVYASNQGAQAGALFGVFNYQGNPRLALFYFKDIAGNVVDDFLVESSLGEGAAVGPPVDPPTEPTEPPTEPPACDPAREDCGSPEEPPVCDPAFENCGDPEPQPEPEPTPEPEPPASSDPPLSAPEPPPLPVPTGAACADGIDNDGDGFADFPADPGCRGRRDRHEEPGRTWRQSR
jgi:Calcineurin-like phosphoesterase